MPLTIVETDAFPTTVQGPASGEPASAPSLMSQFLQPAANRLRWLYNRVSVFVTGGTFTPSNTVTITNSAGITQINDVRFAGSIMAVDCSLGVQVTTGDLNVSVGDANIGGDCHVTGAHTVAQNLTVSGFARARLRITQGNITAGTHTYSSDNFQHVYAVSGPSIPAGCTWQIDDSASSGQEWFRFVNFNSNPIAINNNLGVLLQNIKFGTGFAYAVTVARISGSWTVIDANYL